MTFWVWLGFTTALFTALALPGPALLVLFEISRLRGLRKGVPLAIGIALGDLVLMLAALLGAGVVIEHAPQLFQVVQWLGIGLFGLYILRLLWTRRSRRRALAAPKAQLFRQGLGLSALHPGSLTFFIAFLPQFFDESRPYWPDFWLMAVTGAACAALASGLYMGAGLGVRRAKRRLHNSPKGRAAKVTSSNLSG